MKARYVVVSALMLLAMVLASCAPAATQAPAAEATSAPVAEATSAPASVDPCAGDAFGCAKIPAGQTVKIGMGAPMTGDNAQFGVDISQGAKIAVSGVLDHSQWETNEGAKRSSIQMIANNIEFIKTDGRGFSEGQDQGEETPF